MTPAGCGGGAPPSSPRGFSLVEVLVALAILSLLGIPAVNLFITGARGTAKVEAQALALNLAEEPIELLQSLPYRTLVSRWGEYAPPPFAKGLGREYRRSVAVREVRPGALARIDVTVEWLDGSKRQVALACLVASEEEP